MGARFSENVRAGTFIGLVLWFPCPWYLVAVGGLLPLPVIVLYGFAGGIVLVFSVVHVIVYLGLFYLAARWLRKPIAAASVLLAVFALSFLPIYGSGENLASGGKLNRNAYQAYAEAFAGAIGKLSHLLLTEALAQEASFGGGDGSSCEQAVVPLATEGMALVQAERHWLRKAFGGGSLVRQALGASSDGKRRYDLILWRKPDGQTVDVCFDVTTVFEETIRKVEEEETGDSRSPAR